MNYVQIHFMHESGKDFYEIAKSHNITPKEACMAWAKVEDKKRLFKEKEPVIYRKRMTKSKSHHKSLVEGIKKCIMK